MEVHAFNSAFFFFSFSFLYFLFFFFFKEWTTVSKSLAEFPLTILLLFLELLNVKWADIIQLEGCVASTSLHTLSMHIILYLFPRYYMCSGM